MIISSVETLHWQDGKSVSESVDTRVERDGTRVTTVVDVTPLLAPQSSHQDHDDPHARHNTGDGGDGVDGSDGVDCSSYLNLGS